MYVYCIYIHVNETGIQSGTVIRKEKDHVASELLTLLSPRAQLSSQCNKSVVSQEGQTRR